MSKYIKVLPYGINRVFILKDGTRLDLRIGGVPFNAFDIWKSGIFKYFALLPEAVELLKKEKTETLIALINKSINVEDIKIIASAKEGKKLQESAEARIQFLTIKP